MRRGNEKQKISRIVEKVSKLLGSTIDPDKISEQRLPKKMNTVFQIKVTLIGIIPLIWRRIQTKDCNLVELHDLLQVTMGWEFEHLYRFIIGGIKYADLGMASQEDSEDACDTNRAQFSGAEPPTSVPLQVRLWGSMDASIDRGGTVPPEQGVQYPICVAGQRACPPEDCGGPWGYYAGKKVGQAFQPDVSGKSGWKA